MSKTNERKECCECAEPIICKQEGCGEIGNHCVLCSRPLCHQPTSPIEEMREKIEVIINRHRPIENFGVLETCASEIAEYVSTSFKEKVEEEMIERLFKIEGEKWDDAVHCSCLGYALVELSGGEDSERGKKMSKRLLGLTPPLQEKEE